MALHYLEHYQVGKFDLIFDKELREVSKILGRPFPEFRGAKIHDHPDGELKWIVEASCRGRMTFPYTAEIKFEVAEGTWADGLARAMQRMLGQLCAIPDPQLEATPYRYYAQRDSTGRPSAVLDHPQLGHHVDHLDHMLYSTQQDLDRARTKADLTHFQLLEARSLIKDLKKDRHDLRRARAQRDHTILKLRGQILKLEKTVSDLEAYVEEVEEEGIDLRKENEALISDDDDYLEEEMDMEMEDDEEELVDEEEEDPEELIPEEDEEEEDPEERVFEPEVPVVTVDE